MKRSVGVLVALLMAAAPLAAQQPQPKRDSGPPPHPMMPGMPGMHGQGMSGWMQQMHGGMPMEEMGGMMRMMAFAPGHLLMHKDSLGLTADQVKRLTALRDSAQARQAAAMADAKPHFQALEEQSGTATPDTAALRKHFEAAHAAMGRAHWVMVTAAVQAQAVLTDAQRAKMKTWADSMTSWMEHRRGMMGPPH